MQNTTHFTAHNLSAEKGFSLIEVMISLVIIALGVLGVGLIMLLSANNNDTARIQSLAALEATSMATAIQANEAYWLNGAGATGSFTETAVTASSTACINSTCDAQSMATYDLTNWGYSISNSIPDGMGNVACTTIAATTSTPAVTSCNITVGWVQNATTNDHQAMTAATASTQSYTLVVQP